MSNLGKVLSADLSFATRMAREGVDMLALSQLNQQARQQVHGSARDLLIHQTYVKCEKQPEQEWLAARPQCFAPVVLKGLARAGQRLPPTQYRAVSQFLRHVQAPAAAVNAYQLAATSKPLTDRLLPKSERIARWHQALLADARSVWAEIGRPRPVTGSWARNFFVRSAEKPTVPQRWFSLNPGITLAALLMQRLPPPLVNSRWGESLGAYLGLAAGTLLGCVCFVLAANPLLYWRFARSAQRANQHEKLHGLHSQEVLDRIWPGLPNPYEGEVGAAKSFAEDKMLAVAEAVSAYRWQSQPAPVKARPRNAAGNPPAYPMLDEALIHELDQLQFVQEFNGKVHPDYPSHQLVRWFAGWQRPTDEPAFFGDIVKALQFTHRRNDKYHMPSSTP